MTKAFLAHCLAIVLLLSGAIVKASSTTLKAPSATLKATSKTVKATAGEGAQLVVVRGDGDWPPFEIYRGDILSGFHIETIKAVAASMGLAEPKFISVPWLRALQMVASGHADALTFVDRTPEREYHMLFHEDNLLSTSNMKFFTAPDLKERLDYQGHYRVLRRFKIGTVRGYHYGDNFRSSPHLQFLDKARSEEQLVKQFRDGGFLIGAGDVDIIRYWAAALGVEDRISFLEPEFYQSKAYLAFSKKSRKREVGQAFAASMKRYKTTQAYKRLKEKYGIR